MQQEELKDVERNVGTKITKLDQRDEIGTDRGGYAVHEGPRNADGMPRGEGRSAMSADPRVSGLPGTALSNRIEGELLMAIFITGEGMAADVCACG